MTARTNGIRLGFAQLSLTQLGLGSVTALVLAAGGCGGAGPTRGEEPITPAEPAAIHQARFDTEAGATTAPSIAELVERAASPEVAAARLHLIELAGEYRALRNELMVAGGMNSDLAARIEAADARFERELKAIVDAHGWPTADVFGEPAARAAFLLVQGAVRDEGFRWSVLEQMWPLVQQGRLPGEYFALLADRTRTMAGLPQIFGTQMRLEPDNQGRTVALPATPIRDPAMLDQRRALMGMDAHADYVGRLIATYGHLRLVDDASETVGFNTDSTGPVTEITPETLAEVGTDAGFDDGYDAATGR